MVLLFKVFLTTLLNPFLSETLTPTTYEDSVRKTYIESYDDSLFYVKTAVLNKNINFVIGTSDERFEALPNVEYRPNVRDYLGFGTKIFNIGVNVYLKMPFEDVDRYGKSYLFDLSTFKYGKQWGLEFWYQRYKGFYMANEDDQKEKDLPDQIRPDLLIRNLKAGVVYVFKPDKYSFRSGLTHSEHQIKRNGSFIINSVFTHYKIASDSFLLPQDYRNQVLKEGNLTSSKITAIGIMPGYGYNFPLKRFYINSSFFLGPEVHFYKRNTDFKRGFSAGAMGNLRLAVGFNGKKFFSGISSMALFSGFNSKNLLFEISNNHFQFFAGYRIYKVGIMKKSWHEIIFKKGKRKV